MFRKQFIYGKIKYEDNDFLYIHINDYILSYHKDLHVEYIKEKECVIIGDAWQVLPEKPSPCETVKALNEDTLEKILEEEYSWCGRYVVIYKNHVITDNASLLSVFYADNIISSNCLMLSKVLKLEEFVYKANKNNVMNWFPGPDTVYPEIKRLLPSQTLNIDTGKIDVKKLLHKIKKTDEETYSYFIEIFINSLKNMKKFYSGKQLLVAITGGYDSRTLLSLMIKGQLPFECFSLEHDEIQLDDIVIPPVLCSKMKIPFTYVTRNKEDYKQEKEEEYNHFISGFIDDEDVKYYAHNQYQSLIDTYKDIVLLRSGVWPLVSKNYETVFNSITPNRFFYEWFGIKRNSPEYNSLQKYLEWAHKNSQKIPIDNQFMWEQREGCWLSTIETGFDMIEHVTSVNPVNSRIFMSLLFNLPKDERYAKHHQMKIVQMCTPELSSIPYATKIIYGETSFTKAKRKFKRFTNRLKTFGPIKTVDIYIKIIKTPK